ncbi:T9SS type A sorting domain-containing protein, partial [candidate division GN15 bacterium]|nr:T9SS type A sorting domain-containing protein [candidate division GN15 bacterium]
GQEDLVISSRPVETSEKGALYCYWGGPAFDTIPDLIIERPGEWCEGQYSFGNILEYLGDINGDTYDDLLASSALNADDTVCFVFFGGPGIDSIPDLLIYDEVLVARLAGDINDDGENDLLTSDPFPSSGAGAVRLYLGGSDVDATADWVIRNSDMADYQEYFGKEVAGIGDYTGDGIDDFAFTCRGLSLNGEIYLFSGWDGSTDVEIEEDDGLPESYVLSQNYPNPFNPSTTIEFSLPTRSEISLTVHNVLGQVVRSLVTRELPAGRHRLEWDGTDDSGEPVASGVYLYRLQAGDVVEAKKMVLLK